MESRHLIRALELGPRVLQSAHYEWMHSLLQHLIADAASGASMEDPGYVAHALLAALHVDLVEEMIAGGLSIEESGVLRPHTLDWRSAMGRVAQI